MAALTGDPPELGRRLAALEAMTTPTALPDGTMSPRSGLLMIRGLVGSRRPRPDAHRRPGRGRAREQPRQPLACGGAGRAGPCRIRHRRPSAGTTPPRRGHRSPARPACVRILAYAVLSLCEAEQGDRAASRRHAQLAMTVVTDHAMQSHPNVLPAYTAHGAALAAAGPPTRSDGDTRGGARRVTPGARTEPWPLIHHLIVMAGLTARMGDPDGSSRPAAGRSRHPHPVDRHVDDGHPSPCRGRPQPHPAATAEPPSSPRSSERH